MDRISLLLVLNEAIDALGDIPADKCTEQQREAYRRCVEVRGEIVKIDFLKGWKMENLLKYCILVICLATTIWINGCALGESNRQIVTDDLEVLEPDGYGLGIHKNRYGQPVIVRPDWGYVPGERLDIKIDAYGLGVHSDQYGRPIREYPWP